ncbi:MAG: helix-turn-helix transcriptional regulator, partial [Gemmatimonadaceae bacterium]
SHVVPPDDGAARLGILQGLARARQRLGEYDAAFALWSQVRLEAERLTDPGLVAQAERRMGLSAFWSGRSSEAIAHYTAAILRSLALGDDEGVVKALVARATALRAVGEPTEAMRSLDEALEIAERRGDDGLLARVHRALLLAYAWTGPAERARHHATRALHYARVVGEPAVAWSAHWAMALLAGFTGDGALIAEHLEAAQVIASETGSPVLSVWTGEIVIEHASAVGDWRKGLEVAESVVPLARAVASRTVLPRLLVWKGLILLARDQLADARACFDEAWQRANADAPGRHVDDVHVLIPAYIGRAAYALATADYASAIRYGEHGLALADHYGYRAWAIHRLLPVILESRIWIKDFDGAARDSARLRADSALLDHRLGAAWADAADALNLRFRDRSPQASRAMLAAADELDRVPFVFHAARLRLNAAQLLAAEGARDAALAVLRQVHAVFQQLGAERELRLTRDAIRDLGARPPVRASTSAGVLTSREQEIARLIAQRKTNKEVGAALDISARTVGTHLSNIFEKLGIESRGALVDLVRADPALVEAEPTAAD